MEKKYIVILGRRNNGKSSLINALTGQQTAIVSDLPGTTTDPVKKSYEIPGFASVVFIDTAGTDDEGELGRKRKEKTYQTLPQADLAILSITENRFGEEEETLIGELNRLDIPFLIVHTKADLEMLQPALKQQLEQTYRVPVQEFSRDWKETHQGLITALSRLHQQKKGLSLTGDLLRPQEVVLLITPIDSEAPVGRMILPQVQTIRDILDNHSISIVLQPEEIPAFLHTGIRPCLTITDSQVFKKVAECLPSSWPLTSFSILLARHKGNFDEYVKGTFSISALRDQDRVLILESCSHHVSCEDIGRVKIPALLQKFTGKKLEFDFVAGLDPFPRPLTEYALAIQCGGCMITDKQLQNRLQPFLLAGIPVSNYGMALAYVQGIFQRVIAPFQKD